MRVLVRDWRFLNYFDEKLFQQLSREGLYQDQFVTLHKIPHCTIPPCI